MNDNSNNNNNIMQQQQQQLQQQHQGGLPPISQQQLPAPPPGMVYGMVNPNNPNVVYQYPMQYIQQPIQPHTIQFDTVSRNHNYNPSMISQPMTGTSQHSTHSNPSTMSNHTNTNPSQISTLLLSNNNNNSNNSNHNNNNPGYVQYYNPQTQQTQQTQSPNTQQLSQLKQPIMQQPVISAGHVTQRPITVPTLSNHSQNTNSAHYVTQQSPNTPTQYVYPPQGKK